MSAITLKRSVVNSIQPVTFYLGQESFMGAGTDPRIFCDALKINGDEVAKNIIAVDGGEEISAVTDETAACVVTGMNIERNIKSARISTEIGIVINAETRGKLETQLEALNNSTSQDTFKVEYGAANKKQEFKTDQKWGIIMDLSSLELYTDRSSRGYLTPVSSSYQESIVGSGEENFEILTLEGFLTKQKTIDVGFSTSDENGAIRLNSVKS